MNTDNNFGTLPLLTDTTIRLAPGGRYVRMNRPVCRAGNRLYLPLGSFVWACGGILRGENQQIIVKFPGKSAVRIDLDTLDQKAQTHHRDLYLSLHDFCRIVSLQTVWQEQRLAIALYPSTEGSSQNPQQTGGRPALIRFEDLAAGEQYLESENMEKLRVIGSYLKARNIPFHLAWIPRFVDPPNNIDNDISNDISFRNAEFLFTLDQLLSCGGMLGLHGYTHQHGDEVSAEGTEFSEVVNHTEPEIRTRIEAAIAAAQACGLPVTFFETPHYAADAFQQSIFEQYFDIIYEGYVGIWGDEPVISPRNHRTLYVPTPLGYVEGENGLEELLERIRTISDDALASMFYHVYAEFDFIERGLEPNGAPVYDYREDSPLHQMLEAFSEKGCTLIRVTDLTAEVANQD